MPDDSVVTTVAPASRRPKTLILDVYGRYADQFRGWLAVSDLVGLMALMGVDEQAVRSAISRMSRRGLLRPEIRDRVRGYATTPEADELMAEGDRRIYVSIESARLADGWVVLSFSVPETERDKRHVLRSRLMWLSMGNLSSGLWIAPRRHLDAIRDAVASLGLESYVDVFAADHQGMGDVREMAGRCWNLDALAASYSKFIDRWSPWEAEGGRIPEGADAFANYTLALHEWRKFPYLDPGLPQEVLPVDWPGRSALRLFQKMREDLEPLAFAYAAEVAGSIARHRSGPLSETGRRRVSPAGASLE